MNNNRFEIDDFFDNFMEPFVIPNTMLSLSKPLSSLIKLDIKETRDSLEVIADLPGFNKENIEIEIEDGILTIKAKKEDIKEEKNDFYIRRERNKGEMRRSINIGRDIKEDEINAEFVNGVLTIIIPKDDPHKNKKKLTIN